MNAARLVMPAIRWDPTTGFGSEAGPIATALELGVGGFIVFGGTHEAVSQLTRQLEVDAGRPLLISADLERGAGQQMPGLTELPPPLALASLGELGPARAAGHLTGAEARAVGINWLLGPVADLDLVAENPIVQTRSFGTEPDQVAAQVGAWIAGAREAGVLTCVKHFPGHGRSSVDSHDKLGVVEISQSELERTDLVPFRAAIEAGVDAVMTCHVAFPALDPSGRPATTSTPILDRLRAAMGFDGLVVTDAMIMEGFAAANVAAEAARAAFLAGVDLMLYPPDVRATVRALEAAGHQAAGADRLSKSLRRYDQALTKVTTMPAGRPIDRAVAGDIARRLVRAGAAGVSLQAPLDLVMADDDQDGAYPPSPNTYFEAALRAAGVPLGPGGSRVLLAFAEPRASKGRAGFGPRCRTIFATASADAAILFAHPRLRSELPEGIPVVQAWHRQRLMQEAVADWLIAAL